MVKGITSVSRDGIHCHVFLRGVYGRVYIQNCPPCSTFFVSLYRLVGSQL